MFNDNKVQNLSAEASQDIHKHKSNILHHNENPLEGTITKTQDSQRWASDGVIQNPLIA